MATIDIEGLGKRYGDTEVLHGVDLSVQAGEFVTLLGPSGCGKTTTLRCVAGLERPDAGTIQIGGDRVASGSGGRFVAAEHRNVGMVLQSYALWPHMTVFANVAYPLRVRRRKAKAGPASGTRSRREIARRVMEVLETVDMAPYAERMPGQLSGGQAQRVALARAIVARPRVLLFDEPLSNLDAQLRVSMRREVRAAHERAGTTSLYVTHDQEEAIALSDRVGVMRDGAIEQLGTPREIYERPATRFVARFVGFENVLPGHVHDRRPGAIAVELDGAAGMLWCEHDHGVATGRRAHLAIRSEDVRLTREDSGGRPNVVTARLTSATYAGRHMQYVVDLQGVALTVRTTDDGLGVAPGDAVSVELPPSALLPVAEKLEDVPALWPAEEPVHAPVVQR
jgi:iron(III) transport system ATP-binding protein